MLDILDILDSEFLVIFLFLRFTLIERGKQLITSELTILEQ